MHKNKNMRQIKVTPEENEKLQQLFNVKYNYVRQVLSFVKHGPTAERIRREAIRMGGRYVDPDFSPNCTTQYVGGMIIQTFGDQVVLRIDKNTGDITLEHHGRLIDKREKESMAIWNAMAMKAQALAESSMVAR